jgi:hypothetical protein
MILESTISLYNNIKALFSAIDSARNEIAQKIPDMYNWFGAGDIKEDPSWDKAIGVLTSAFGLFGELTTAGMGTRVATVALGGAFASALLPEAPKEQKFERASQSVSTFTSNVQIILDVINDYIDTQFVKPAPGPKGGNEINNFLADPHGFVNLISSGAYAGNSPVDVGARNQSIVASLAAPLINEMWIQAQIFVAHFRASDWTGGDWGEAHGGKNLCDESFKFFEDIQADGKICDPNTGDLKMLMHFGKTPGANWAPGVREIPGLDLLGPQFYITRKQIIDASEANQHLGWLKLPTADEMMKRYSDFASSQLLAAGNLNVWNLPYCYVQQAKSINAKMDIEEFMAISAMGCAQGKDGTGAPFPYQSEKITPCTRC